MNSREQDTLPLLGLNEYEAKAYRALLAEHPATAYRIAQMSGVPQGRVYEIAARLVEKGAATAQPGKPARYAPIPPDELIAAARSRAARQLDELAADLREVYAGPGDSPYAYVRGETAVLAQAEALAADARDVLVVAGAPEAVDAVARCIRTCDARLRTLALPSAPPDGYALAILADSRRALIGHLGKRADALVTDHPVVVAMLADYLMHRAVSETAQDMAAARTASAEVSRRTDWQAWEEDKHRRLLSVH